MSLSRYSLLEKIGEGGMAEVHLARLEAPGGVSKLCVLKTIRPDLPIDAGFREAFFEEARLALSLDHGSIVHTFDFGETDNRLYLAMEWCDAGDLERLMHALAVRGESMPVPIACTVSARILEGLRYAHEARDAVGHPLELVHRDVSPSNVLLTFSGEAKLADFGISRATQRRMATGAGLVKGKPPYLSPEQARGEVATVQSDVFSCGVLLWEMLVGSRLFEGGDTRQILAKVAEARIPRPDLRRPDLPVRLTAIALRALAADPAERFPRAEDFYRELIEFSRESGFSLDAATLSAFFKERLGDREKDNARVRTTTPVMTAVVPDGVATSRPKKNHRSRFRDLAIAAAGAAVSLIIAWVMLAGGPLSRRAAIIEPADNASIPQVRPRPDTAVLNLDADPVGALVVTDGRPSGFAPVRASVSVEKRSRLPVRVGYPGWNSSSTNMIFGPGAEKNAKRSRVGATGVLIDGRDRPFMVGSRELVPGESLRLTTGLYRTVRDGQVRYERIGEPNSPEQTSGILGEIGQDDTGARTPD